MLLPVAIADKPRRNARRRTRPPRPLHMMGKGLLLCVSIVVAASFGDALWAPVLHFVLLLVMFLPYELLVDAARLICSHSFALDIEPAMDQPYFARSLNDFWGRRWNLTASATLRDLIYCPIADGRLYGPAPGSGSKGPVSPIRRSVAVMATFACSGALHEYFIWMTTGYLTGEWGLFFCINGAALVLEDGAKRLCGTCVWPKWVTVPLTIAFLITTAELLFIPPVLASGWADLGLEEMTRAAARVMHGPQVPEQQLLRPSG